MSHLLTFMNHGCNGTANTGDLPRFGITEFTVDLESGVVPDDLSTKVNSPYLPHFDRDEFKQETMCHSSKPIKAGQELFDNYMTFGGDHYFQEMVEMLRQECSGSLGMVEQYQQGEHVVTETRVVAVGDSATMIPAAKSKNGSNLTNPHRPHHGGKEEL